MGTIAEKLQIIADVKAELAQVIDSHGGTVPTAFPDYPEEVRNLIEAGGSEEPGEPVGDIEVRFVSPVPLPGDTTTILRIFVNKGANVELPVAPDLTAQGLTFQGWTHTAAELQNIQRDVHVGAIYEPTDGKTRLFVTVNQAVGRSLTLLFNLKGGAAISINWGDGTAPSVSTAGEYEVTHTYASDGDYQIAITKTANGTIELGWTSTSDTQRPLFGTIWNYSYQLTKAYLSNDITDIGEWTFHGQQSLYAIIFPNIPMTIRGRLCSYCSQLRSIVLNNTTYLTFSTFKDSKGITSHTGGENFSNCVRLENAVIKKMVTYATQSELITTWGRDFIGCFMLASIVIPSTMDVVPRYFLANCYKLMKAIFEARSSNVLNIGAYCFSQARAMKVMPDFADAILYADGSANYGYVYAQAGLEDVVVPSNMNHITQGMFQGGSVAGGASENFDLATIRSVDIPDSVSLMGANAFNLTNITTIVVRRTTPPTISASTFGGIHPFAKIYVPDTNVNAYKAATNWSVYASRIFPLSQKPA